MERHLPCSRKNAEGHHHLYYGVCPEIECGEQGRDAEWGDGDILLAVGSEDRQKVGREKRPSVLPVRLVVWNRRLRVQAAPRQLRRRRGPLVGLADRISSSRG